MQAEYSASCFKRATAIRRLPCRWRSTRWQIATRQLDAVFSITRLCGVTQPPTRWGDLGAQQPDWASQPLQRYGRNPRRAPRTSLSSRPMQRRFARRCGGVPRLNRRGAGGRCQSAQHRRLRQLRLSSQQREDVRRGRCVRRGSRALRRLYPQRPLYLYVNRAPRVSRASAERAVCRSPPRSVSRLWNQRRSSR